MIRTFGLAYTFTASPRHLPTSGSFISRDGLTSSSNSSISSYATTADGVRLHFTLSGAPNGPLILLIPSVLVDHSIFDNFIKSLPNTYRICAFTPRGRESLPEKCEAAENERGRVTIDVLARDALCILDGLRVKKAACVLGVSCGGITALNLALRFPERFESAIVCDTSAAAPDGNEKTWGERLQIAEKEGCKGETGELIGDKLADLTVKRWFVPSNHSHSELSRLRGLVRQNSLPGFKALVQALHKYDVTPLLPSARIPAAFVVGSGDGVLPAGMEQLARVYGSATRSRGVFKVIDGTGHLPMVEKPEEVAEFATGFLRDNDI